MIRTIFFDADDTLYDEAHGKTRAQYQTILRIASLTGREPSIVCDAFWAADAWVENGMKGKPAANDRRLWFAETLRLLGNADLSGDELAEYY